MPTQQDFWLTIDCYFGMHNFGFKFYVIGLRACLVSLDRVCGAEKISIHHEEMLWLQQIGAGFAVSWSCVLHYWFIYTMFNGGPLLLLLIAAKL